MKCAEHPEVDATGYCRQCGKPLCPACTRDVRGALYCESCLAALVAAPQSVAAASGTPNPGLAALLGFIPGLGAVYNGEYVKALIQVLIFGGIIAALTTDLPAGVIVILAIALGCFYFYMPIEAHRVAKAKRAGQPEPPDLVVGQAKRPVGAIILIGLGIFILLANFHLIEREWFARLWPAGLILLGVWILLDRMRRTS